METTTTTPTTGTSPETDVVEQPGADSVPTSPERAVLTGRTRRLEVIRWAMLFAAGLNVATVFGPWWVTRVPEHEMMLTLGGNPVTINLGEGEGITTGLQGNELTRVLLVAAGAAAIFYALGKFWWWVAPVVFWVMSPPISLTPPATAPASRLGHNSPLIELSTDTVWLTMNRGAFYALVFLTLSGGVQAFRVRRAAVAVEKAEGRPAGIWERHVLPKLADLGVSLTIDPKNGRS